MDICILPEVWNPHIFKTTPTWVSWQTGKLIVCGASISGLKFFQGNSFYYFYSNPVFLSVLEKTLIVSSATLIRACTQIYAHTQPTHLGYLTLKC